MSGGTFTVTLRGDQMQCVVDALTFLVGLHAAAIHPDRETPATLGEFAHRISRDRIAETLGVFTEGHGT